VRRPGLDPHFLGQVTVAHSCARTELLEAITQMTGLSRRDVVSTTGLRMLGEEQRFSFYTMRSVAVLLATAFVTGVGAIVGEGLDGARRYACR
jgi:hypothetical protein